MQERRHRHLPALSLLAEPVGVRHLDVVEEDLVELGLSGDLPQWAHLDSGRVHVHDQVREVVVPPRVRIALRDQDAEVGDVRERRPDLLAVDHVDVAAAVRAGAGRSEVGAGVRLGEPLAPDLVRGEDLREVRLLLLLRAVRDDRRAGHPEPDHADVRRRVGPGRLLVEDRLEAVRGSGTAVFLRPGQAGVAGVVEHPAPFAAERVVEALGAAPAAAPLLRQVRRDPGAQLGPEGGLLGGVAQVHGPSLSLRRGSRQATRTPAPRSPWGP